MFKDVGIIDNDINLFSMASFDIDKHCQKSSDALFEVIENAELFFNQDRFQMWFFLVSCL